MALTVPRSSRVSSSNRSIGQRAELSSFRGRPSLEKACGTCNKTLPKLDENLLKDSLRMKSEVAKLSTHRNSLMNMLSTNDDFSYSLKPGERAATTGLIDNARYQSVMNKCAEVLRNRGLHDCANIHTNSRKREYKRWDTSHAALAQRYLTYSSKLMKAWMEAEQTEGYSEHESDDNADEDFVVEPSYDNSRMVTAKSGAIRRPPDTAQDRYEEEMEESDRIQMTVDNIRKSRKGGMLAEIHQIKDRHKQLEALTQTKRRAMTGSETVKPSSQRTDSVMQKDTLKKILLQNANLEKDLNFNQFKERTTVKLNRKFKETTKAEGFSYAHKWSNNHSTLPGKISKSTNPQSDARKGLSKTQYTPAKPGDLPPCIYLPRHIQNGKTPIESALMLDRFIKDTILYAEQAEQDEEAEQGHHSKTLPYIKKRTGA